MSLMSTTAFGLQLLVDVSKRWRDAAACSPLQIKQCAWNSEALNLQHSKALVLAEPYKTFKRQCIC